VNQLEAFVQTRYVTFNSAVTGIGIDHDTLVHAVRKMTIRQGNVEPGKQAKFYSGKSVIFATFLMK